MPTAKRAWLAALTTVLVGCATLVPSPFTGGPTPFEPPEDAWARVLTSAVDEQGRVDFNRVGREQSDLATYVSWIYGQSPANRPEFYRTREAALAYHLNAYNALAMYNVLTSGVPTSISVFERAAFFENRKMFVGGRPLSLSEYDTLLIRPLGEPRLNFALNNMTVGAPPLSREPFVGERLEQQLDRAARRFFNDERYVRQDDASRKVYLSPILQDHQAEFLAVAPSLLAYANRYRDAKLPEDYAVKFNAYDWTINRQR